MSAAAFLGYCMLEGGKKNYLLKVHKFTIIKSRTSKAMCESVGPNVGRSLLASYGGIAGDRVNNGRYCMNPGQ
jgi:hypothetical protein